MKPRFVIFFGFLFLLITAFCIPQLALSAEVADFTVTIFPKGGDPFVIKKFTYGPIRTTLDANWRGSTVVLEFKDISSIKFGKAEGAVFESEILFKDGKKDTFKLYIGSEFRGESGFGPWRMMAHQIAMIDYSAKGKDPRPQTIENDQIILKNGDVISGQIKTKAFTLKASYGEVKFKTEEIENINFEGGGQNIDMVVLRVGDKLSGVVQESKITMLLRSGTEIILDKDKIKDINFKK